MNFHVYERADGALLLLPTLLAPPAAGAPAELRVLGSLECDLAIFSAGLVTELGLHGRAQVTGRDRELLVARMRRVDASPAAASIQPVSSD
ncbi:MAG TPA: hypothetical protein VFE72_06625 [Lysobacter sp.]|nr:hypothetical protein [Lysobacter sp.]